MFNSLGFSLLVHTSIIIFTNIFLCLQMTQWQRKSTQDGPTCQGSKTDRHVWAATSSKAITHLLVFPRPGKSWNNAPGQILSQHFWSGSNFLLWISWGKCVCKLNGKSVSTSLDRNKVRDNILMINVWRLIINED